MRTGALGLFFFLFLIIVFYCFLNLWFAGRLASSAIVLIPSVSWCVPLLGCCRLLLCVVVAAVSISLLSLYVDWALVFAEGHTQVTGVMAMMMTGRVLLVCALSVLWCGAGGRCDEVVVRAPAGGAGDKSEPLVQSQELVASRQGSQELKDGAPVFKRESTPTPSDGEDDDDGKGEGDGQEDGSPSELEEPVKDAPDQGKTKSTLQNKEQEIRQPPQSQVNVQQQPQPPLQQSQTQLQPQPNTSASEKGEGVGENSRGGAVQSSLGVEDKGNEDPKSPRKEDSLRSPGEE
ncbi:mucin-associated surface protein (MASP) [Trypanosoma cruzi Dm28c]|uniref:Mucin-associated surface protein (MASP) n=1 Tax=Trypanosoma cruzi Dm28c TaxID=1416333 RepID=V5B2I8_TRYCR|nr:mucin-associated surface protein (MASP) [Trypanosoma cruzi Dm28c]